MGHYNWTGPGMLEETTHVRTKAPEITEPTSIDVAGTSEPLLKCTECGKQYRKAMIFARHFNSTHKELKKDSDTWRNYVEE